MESFDPNSEASLARLAQLHRRAQVGGCVNGVAHDINNLLGAAMAYAELVSYDENISPDSAKMLTQVVDGISKCSRLVSSLTSIARKDKLDVSLASPEQLADEVLVLRDYELKLNRIEVERAYDEDLPTVSVDMAKIKLALIFLLVNAQEAVVNAALKKVKLSVTRTENGVCYAVWDSGPGLSDEVASRAFEPLYSAWPEGEHMGFGLYTARQIAKLHGGDVEYHPEQGFRLTINRDSGLGQERG